MDEGAEIKNIDQSMSSKLSSALYSVPNISKYEIANEFEKQDQKSLKGILKGARDKSKFEGQSKSVNFSLSLEDRLSKKSPKIYNQKRITLDILIDNLIKQLKLEEGQEVREGQEGQDGNGEGVREGVREGKNPDISSYIKDPISLIETLEDLQNIVGLKEAKDAMARHTFSIINQMRTKRRSGKPSNYLILGPPGVGKTTLGILMADILEHTGYFEKARKNSLHLMFSNIMEDEQYSMMALVGAVAIFSGSLAMFSGFIAMFADLVGSIKQHPKTIGVIILGLLGISLITYVSYTYYKSRKSNMNNSSRLKKKKKVHERKHVIITGRQDYISKYVGNSDKKATQTIRKNKGKAIVIDEFYSLCGSGSMGDSYGEEALTVINREMTEDPEGQVIIALGYKDKIYNGPFKVQPGLISRFTNRIECKGYTPEELYEIFERQLEKDYLKISTEDQPKIKELFHEYSSSFQAYGRDTERLVTFAQQRQSERLCFDPLSPLIEDEDGVVYECLTFEDVKYGIEDLSRNTLEESETEEINSSSVSEGKALNFFKDFLKNEV